MRIGLDAFGNVEGEAVAVCEVQDRAQRDEAIVTEPRRPKKEGQKDETEQRRHRCRLGVLATHAESVAAQRVGFQRAMRWASRESTVIRQDED